MKIADGAGGIFAGGTVFRRHNELFSGAVPIVNELDNCREEKKMKIEKYEGFFLFLVFVLRNLNRNRLDFI